MALSEFREGVREMADERSIRQCSRLFWLIEPLLFLLLAVAATWPLASQMDSAIPTGQERVATVPLFNLWTIWWNADRAEVGFANYWNAPIFAPSENAFAFSETQPTTVVVAPVVWTSESRALACNLYLLTMLVANGWTGSLLVRGLTSNRIVGICSGTAFLLLPFVHWQLGVLQLSQLSGTLLTLHFLIRFLTDYRMKDALLAGGATGFCYLCCNYYGYQLCLTLLFALPVLLAQRCNLRRLATGGFVTVVVASAIILPIALTQLSTSNRNSWDRRPETVSRLSAVQDDYFRTLWRGPLSSSSSRKARFPLSPGLACSTLAVIGVVVGFRRQDTRRVTLFLLLFLVVAAQLSIGPGWVFLGQRPFEHLADWLPGLSAMRSPYRFAVLVQVSCVVLASLSFVRVNSGETTVGEVAADKVPAAGATKWQQLLKWGRVALLCGVLIESWPEQPGLYAMPEYEQQRPWIEWLRTETQPDDIVTNLPFPRSRSVTDYEDTAVSMLWSTYHKRRLANGYSGFFPKEFVRLKADVQNFPDDKSVIEFQKAGVRWCVVDLGKLERANVDMLSDQSLLSLQFETDDGMTRIYEVKPRE
jgi:hypothetical protein